MHAPIKNSSKESQYPHAVPKEPSVGVLDQQLPQGVPEVGVRGGTRRDQEPDGEARDTRLDRFGPQCA